MFIMSEQTDQQPSVSGSTEPPTSVSNEPPSAFTSALSDPATNAQPPSANKELPTALTELSSVNSSQPSDNPEQQLSNQEKDPSTIQNKLSSNTNQQQPLSQQTTPQRSVTKVKLSDELNIFDWFRTTDIINQIAERAKNSVGSVITVLDPGMKEYLYSGGNINIIVISDSACVVSPIRDAFQSVFGRATVVAARHDTSHDYPIKIGLGFDGSIKVAEARIQNLRSDTSNVPQNQVVVAVQPSIVQVIQSTVPSICSTAGPEVDQLQSPKWFLTYCMLIEDPILGATISSYSQFIPLDDEIIDTARQAKFQENCPKSANLIGYPVSIDQLLSSKLKLAPEEQMDEEHGSVWLQRWAGLYETQVIHQCGLSLAHSYKRRWNESVVNSNITE